MPTLLLTERELQQVIAILVESKKEEFLKKKYNVDDFAIDVAKIIDPTPNNKYMEWLVKQDLADSWWYAYKKEHIADMLELYAKDNIRKSLPKEYQDINGFDSIDIFVTVMREINPADFVSKTEAYKQTYRGRAGKYKVYQPTTYAQSCKLGSGTNWCTSADSDEGRRSFKSYTRNDKILLIFIDGEDKYQYASGGEFKDKKNEDVDIPKDILLWLVDNGYRKLDFKDKLAYNLPLTDEELHVKGTLDLYNNKTIKELPNGLRVERNLILHYTNIEKLSDDLYVGGNLNLSKNKTLKELSDGLRVGGDLDLSYTEIEKLGKNTYVGGDLYLSNNKTLKELPDSLRVKRDLYLGITNIEKLPDNLYVGGELNLYKNKTIKELPNGLRVGGDLILKNTNIEKLSNGMKVGGSLFLEHTIIKELPSDLYVGGDLFIGNDILTNEIFIENYTDKEIRSMVKHIGGEIKRRNPQFQWLNR